MIRPKLKIAASREFLRRMNAAVAGEESVVVESTLSVLTFQRLIEKAEAAGFEITIVYLFLESAHRCIDRVHERVLKGGRNVPDSDIRRRFLRSVHNFWNLYRPLSDDWAVIYNAGDKPQDVAAGTSTDVLVRDVELFALFQQLVSERH